LSGNAPFYFYRTKMFRNTNKYIYLVQLFVT
jgi:energy-converting hydrogenase Eha subunit H